FDRTPRLTKPLSFDLLPGPAIQFFCETRKSLTEHLTYQRKAALSIGGTVLRNAAFFAFILFTASAALVQVVASNDAAKKLQALFEEDWQWNLKEFPENATLLGDNRYNNLLT